jgi:hypothetical protein
VRYQAHTNERKSLPPPLLLLSFSPVLAHFDENESQSFKYFLSDFIFLSLCVLRLEESNERRTNELKTPNFCNFLKCQFFMLISSFKNFFSQSHTYYFFFSRSLSHLLAYARCSRVSRVFVLSSARKKKKMSNIQHVLRSILHVFVTFLSVYFISYF